jgi:hypothetical protein
LRCKADCVADDLTLERGYHGKRPRTWARITRSGRNAPHEEITQLKALIAQIESRQDRSEPAQ